MRLWVEEQVILTLKISIAAKVDAIIRLGYFKHKPLFFPHRSLKLNRCSVTAKSD